MVRQRQDNFYGMWLGEGVQEGDEACHAKKSERQAGGQAGMGKWWWGKGRQGKAGGR